MSIKHFGLLSVLLAAPFFGYAKNQMDQFESQELRSIRSVSQSILKVRGEKRRAIFAEVKPVMDDLDEMKRLLDQVMISKRRPVIDGVSRPSTILVASVNLKTGKAALPRKMTEVKKNASMSLLKGQKSNELVSIAKGIALSRKVTLDKKIPPKWMFWRSADPRLRRLSSTFDSLVGEFESIESSTGDEQIDNIRRLAKRLKRTKPVKDETVETVPTFSSITKHYRK
ncbi:MAG: hypothetical protein KUG79_13945 [Pseudomonadales bacterium]|nr:hypothetical protein [Pseudomonadales bacterium]